MVFKCSFMRYPQNLCFPIESKKRPISQYQSQTNGSGWDSLLELEYVLILVVTSQHPGCGGRSNISNHVPWILQLGFCPGRTPRIGRIHQGRTRLALTGARRIFEVNNDLVDLGIP